MDGRVTELEITWNHSLSLGFSVFFYSFVLFCFVSFFCKSLFLNVQ